MRLRYCTVEGQVRLSETNRWIMSFLTSRKNYCTSLDSSLHINGTTMCS